MKRLIPYFIFSTVALLLFVQGCKKDTVSSTILHLPDSPYDYTSAVANEFDNGNPVSDNGATLGRVLFYDGHLSLNNSVSCATCHKQQYAFADNVDFSVGFEAKLTQRNSMPLINPRRESAFFWDQRSRNLEEQVLMPVKNHIEMGMEKMDNLAAKLSALDIYPPLFEKAFGTPEITSDRVSKALAQFLKSMVTSKSKFDVGEAQEFANFSPLEKMGMTLFTEKLHCGGCHSGEDFNGWGGSSADIGLDEVVIDRGIGAIADNPFMDGWFKIPSLRNVELTAPYMHDGRFKTLEEVIEHYVSGIHPRSFTDWRLSNEVIIAQNRIFGFADLPITVPVNGLNNQQFLSSPAQLNLTRLEKDALIAFMKTLTDNTFVRDKKFSNPFRAN